MRNSAVMEREKGKYEMRVSEGEKKRRREQREISGKI